MGVSKLKNTKNLRMLRQNIRGKNRDYTLLLQRLCPQSGQ